MTNYVTEAVKKVSSKKIMLGLASAGVLACGSVGAASALSLSNSGTRDANHTQSMQKADGSADGTLWVDGGLQGSSTAMQGDSTSGDMQKTSTAGAVNGAVGTDVSAAGATSSQQSSDNEWGSGSRSSETNGNVNAGVNANVSATGATQTSNEPGDDTSAQAGSADLGLGLNLGLNGSSSSSSQSADDGLLSGGLLGL
jgi:hypothetical protein